MEDGVVFKKTIVKRLTSMLEERAAEAEDAIRALEESRESETKSSAGDKYETARAMIQIEMDKYEMQVSHTRHLLHELATIDTEKKYSRAETGSLVLTSEGNYFLAVGIGKVELENETVFVISAASPLGGALKGLAAGDTGTFQGKKYVINRIA